MESANNTHGAGFLLTQFSTVLWVNYVFFLLFLTIYLVTLLGNLLLILLRRIHSHLQTPMYFFLSHLSFLDICYTTTSVPKLLAIFLINDTYISFLGCATQMFFSLTLGATECLILAIMAYDRSVAICNPLRYPVLMSPRTCILLTSACWISGLANSFLHTTFTFRLPFCKSRDMRHFFCEIQPLLKLSCADTRAHEVAVFASAVVIGLCAFLLTLFSYFQIIVAVLRICSSEGRSKAFSTCSSHLMVVIIFYTTIMTVYMKPISSFNPERGRVISVFYTVLIPMCNPIIYSMRNTEVKEAFRKSILKKCSPSKC
ncbi:olfactory receptor 10A2-like [Ambystoma mexicanum]|uniref:olfactory receptor 10A2-like n=1 Tax=Ambystoma mexicanum TaxID=8296 RepID=UPI0037E8678F